MSIDPHVQEAFATEDVVINLGSVENGWRVQVSVAGLVMKDEVFSEKETAMDYAYEWGLETRTYLDSLGNQA